MIVAIRGNRYALIIGLQEVRKIYIKIYLM